MLNKKRIINENTKVQNPNWPKNPNHPRKINFIAGSGSGKNLF